MGAGLSAALGQRAREVCGARLRSDAGWWSRQFGWATRVACGPNGRRGEELGQALLVGREGKEKGFAGWVGVGFGFEEKGKWASGLGFQLGLGLVSSSILFSNSNQTNTIRNQIQI